MFRFINDHTVEWSFNVRGRRIRRREAAVNDRAGLQQLQAKEAEIRRAIALGKFKERAFFSTGSDVPVTMREGLEAYRKSYRQDLAKSTVKAYDSMVKTVNSHLGRLRLDEVDRRELRAFFNDLDISPHSKRNMLGMIKAVLDRAVEDGVLHDNPATGFKVERNKARDTFSPVRRGDVWSGEEIIRLSQADPIWQFWAWTGLRTGEILALKWSDVDLKAGFISIRASKVLGETKTTKTDAGIRRVPLLIPSREALLKQRPVSELAQGYVWGYRDHRGAWHGFASPESVYKRLARDCQRLGIRFLPPKQFRHTAASFLINSGEDPYWVSKIIGHTNPSITMRVYADFMPDAHADRGKAAVSKFWEEAR